MTFMAFAMKKLQQTFTVEATIAEFTKARAWFFVTCKQCSNRIREHNFTYSCNEHKQQHLSYSYSVNCNIEDHTGSANVTVFDKGIITMLGIRCYDMLTKENNSDSRILPKPIEAQRGSKWIFQIKNGARYGNSVIRFTANNVFPAPITTPPTLTAPTSEDNLKLYITGGENSTTKRQLFKNEGDEGPSDKKLKAKQEE